jgi:DNA-binding MarR family transcriptional regulator
MPTILFFFDATFFPSMKKQELPLGMIVAGMNREMFRVLRNRFMEFSEIKITIEQFGLLFAISNNEQEVVQQDMANFLAKNKSSILRLIDTLEDKMLVERIIDSNDKRKNCLVVTVKGHEVIKQYLNIEFSLMKELQRGLTDNEISTFYKVVQTIRENAEKL